MTNFQLHRLPRTTTIRLKIIQEKPKVPMDPEIVIQFHIEAIEQ